jgi:U4/U6 small nuclear ribonucleoprotein PRP31
MPRLDDDLLDLEGLSDDGGEPDQNDTSMPPPPVPPKRKADAMEDDDDELSDIDDEPEDEEAGGLVLEGGVKPAEELDAEDVQRMELGTVEDVSKVAKLHGSKRMTEILKVCNLLLSFSTQYNIMSTGYREVPSEPVLDGIHVVTCARKSRV